MATIRFLLALVLVVFSGAVLVRPATSEAPEAQAPLALHVVRGDRSYDLDPHSTSSGGDAAVIFQIYEGLVRPSVNAPLSWQPGLAESWELSADKKAWTFKLKKGVKFHDGADFNAAAAKKCIERLLLDDHPARPVHKPYHSYTAEMSSVNAPDEYTLVINQREPNPRMLSTLGLHCFVIISPLAIDRMARMASPRERQEWLTRNPAGTGPFQWADPGEFRDDVIELKAFAGYHGGSPTVSALKFTSMAEDRARLTALQNQTADLLPYVPPGSRDSLRKLKHVHLHEQPGQNLCYLAMNCGGGAMQSLDLRRAVAHAIRRDQLVSLNHDAATPQHTLLPASMFGHPAGYMPTGDELPEAEAIKAAKALIADAGGPKRPLVLLFPDVPRPYLTQPDETANRIWQQLEAVGLEVKLERISLSEVVGRANAGDYDLLLIGWMGDTGEPDNFYSPLLGGRNGEPSGNNLARFYDEEVVGLIDLARRESDPAKRTALYAQLEKLVFDEHRPMVPLYTTSYAAAWSRSLTGVEVDATGRLHVAQARRQ